MTNNSMSSSVLCAKHVRLIQLIRDLLIWTIFFKEASLMLTNHLSISVTYHVTHLINPQDSALLHHLGTQSLSVSRLPFLCVLPSVSGLGERERHALTKFLWGFLRSGMDYICLFSFKADNIKQIITRKKSRPWMLACTRNCDMELCSKISLNKSTVLEGRKLKLTENFKVNYRPKTSSLFLVNRSPVLFAEPCPRP